MFINKNEDFSVGLQNARYARASKFQSFFRPWIVLLAAFNATLQNYFQARIEILKVFTRHKPVVDFSLDYIARQTDGFTGADLENLCNEVFSFCPYSGH